MAAADATDDEVEALGEKGWFSRDAFLDGALVDRLAALAKRIDFKRAGIGRGAEASAERTDEIAWLERPQAPELFDCFDALKRSLRLGLDRYDVQLARYAPGAAYARHRDAFKGPRSRRVTAIVYLLDGGGPLRLHAPAPLDISPARGRLVVFVSDQIDHEVLASNAPRLAVTAWYYGADAPK